MTPRTFVVSLVLLATGCGSAVIRIPDQGSPAIALARLRDSLPRVGSVDSAVYVGFLQWWETCATTGREAEVDREPYLTTGRCGKSAYAGPILDPVVGMEYMSDTSSVLFRRRAETIPLLHQFASANRGQAFLHGLDLGPELSVRWYGLEATPFDAAVTQLSRIGYSSTGDTAIVSGFTGCGPFCGSGAQALMVKTPAGWRFRRLLSWSVS